MLTVSHGSLGSPEVRVLCHLRRVRTGVRTEIARATHLGPATVSRAVAKLVAHGYVEERRDMAAAGVVGRPIVPVQLSAEYGVLGVFIGRFTTTVTLADLRGRILATRELETQQDPERIVTRAAAALRALRDAEPELKVGHVGLTSNWRDRGLDPEALAAALRRRTGLEVRAAEHVQSVAAAEQAVGFEGSGGETLYVYACETVGFAVAHETSERTSISRVFRLEHLPCEGSTHPCECGRTGCLEATVGAWRLAARAHRAGWIERPEVEPFYAAAAAGDSRVIKMIHERTRHLAVMARTVVDMVQPDRVVLVG